MNDTRKKLMLKLLKQFKQELKQYSDTETYALTADSLISDFIQDDKKFADLYSEINMYISLLTSDDVVSVTDLLNVLDTIQDLYKSSKLLQNYIKKNISN